MGTQPARRDPGDSTALDANPGLAERNAAMLRDYRSGITQTDIAKNYGLSLSWTGRLLRDSGATMPPMRRGVRRADLDESKIVRDYRNRGLSIAAIAKHHRAGYGTIRRVLLGRRVKLRPRSSRKRSTRREPDQDDQPGPRRLRETSTVRGTRRPESVDGSFQPSPAS